MRRMLYIWLALVTHWFKCNENDKPHHFIQAVLTLYCPRVTYRFYSVERQAILLIKGRPLAQ